jgi:tetrahydromethanopterin S-methyltransferase subunit G
VWPTLPAPAASAPAVDLSETNKRLDNIAELLLQIRTERATPAEALAPQAAQPPQAADQKQALDVAQAAADDAAKLKARLDTTEETVGGLQTAVKTWVAEHGSLKERVEARLEKVREQLGEEASQREVRIAYVKDLITEKMSGGGMVGLLKLLGMPAGLILAAWLVSRRIEQKREAGQPLLAEKLIADVSELKGRLHSRLYPDQTSSG